MSELPEGWEVVELGEIASVEWGNTSITKKSYVESGYVAYSAAGPDGYLSHFENEGDGIVLSAIGAGCGKCFRASGRWTAIKNTITIKPQPGISNGFLFYYLNNPKSWEISGSGQPFITLGSGRKNSIPVPPVAEQTRIAAKLDELLAQVDTLKARIDGIPALLKRFRQSVLAAAVSGRLTEAWRAVNAPEIASSFDNGWRTTPVDQLSADEKYSLAIGPFGSNLKVSDYREEGRPLIFVREIRSERFGDEKTKFITCVKFAELSAHQVSAGDILITKMGDPPGDVAIYPENAPDAVITADCIKFRVDESVILRKFAYFQMKSELFRQKIQEISAGVAQQKVSLGNFRGLALLVPPLAEQTEIVRRVEQIFAFADQLEVKVASAKSRIDHLTQSILAKAFRGELVPQDPNDEPASVLLERIKAQRAAAPKVRRGRKASV